MGGAGDRSQIFAPGLLRGRVALVTGGGTGLGKATATELARGGGLGGCTGGGGRDWGTADVREPADGERLVRSVLERHGRLDLLVNNAGGQYFAPAEQIATKGWGAVWRLNVGGMLNMSEAAFELAFRPAGGGTIVNVTLSPHHGMPGMAHSGAARATVEALTRELAQRWADAGITVAAVAAGHFDTEVLAKYPESVRKGGARTVPLQRLGEPAEHAWLVTLLASPLGRAFNGSTLTLDGAAANWMGPWPPPGLGGEAGA